MDLNCACFRKLPSNPSTFFFAFYDTWPEARGQSAEGLAAGCCLRPKANRQCCSKRGSRMCILCVWLGSYPVKYNSFKQKAAVFSSLRRISNMTPSVLLHFTRTDWTGHRMFNKMRILMVGHTVEKVSVTYVWLFEHLTFLIDCCEESEFIHIKVYISVAA